MHTLFATPLRTLLIKFGIENAEIHVTLEIAISLAGPIIAAFIMKKVSSWIFPLSGKVFLYEENINDVKKKYKKVKWDSDRHI